MVFDCQCDPFPLAAICAMLLIDSIPVSARLFMQLKIRERKKSTSTAVAAIRYLEKFWKL